MLKIQKYLYYILFLITPFIMYSGTSELFEFNKMIFIYMITSLILTVWVMRMVQSGKFLIKKTPFDIFIVLFYISQILSTVFSIDRHVSIFGYYGRFNGGLLSLTAYLILYYSFAQFMSQTARETFSFIRNLLKITLLSSTAVILWGLPGKIGHDLSCLVFSGRLDNTCWTAQFDPAARMFSTLGQPNWLGAYLVIAFFIVLYFFLTSKRLYYFPVLILNLIAVFFTNSRSSVLTLFIGLAATFVWLMIFRHRVEIPSFKNKTVMLALSLIVCTLVFKTGVSKIDRYLNPSTYLNMNAKTAPVQKKAEKTQPVQLDPLKITESLDIRKIVWKGATDLGLQYPVFGTGVETFAYSYYFVRPQEHNLTSEWDYLYNKAHNEYLNFFATTGFTGIMTYSLFIIAVMALGIYWSTLSPSNKGKLHSESLLQLCLLASWSTILVTNFIGFSTTTINLYFYTIPVLIYFLETRKVQEGETSSKKAVHTAEGSGNLISYLIIVVCSLFLLQFFATYWMADTKYALAENYAKANDYESSVTLLTSALRLYQDHVYEDKISYYMANLAFLAAYQKNARLANELMKASESYNAKSLKESPENILYWKTRVKNQYLFYQISLNKQYLDNGISALNQSRKLSPTDAKIPYFLATYYSLLWDEEKDLVKRSDLQKKSLDAVNTSLRLKDDYYESYYLKAQLLRKYKMMKEAGQVYEYILKYISPNNEQIKKELQSI